MGVERQLWQHKNRCGWGFRQRQGANTSTSARVVDGVSSLRICPPKSMLWYFSSVVFVLMLLLCVCVCFFISVYVAFTTYLLSLSSRPYWPQYSLIPLVPGWRFFNESFGALEIYNTSCSQPSFFAAGLANLLLLLLLLLLSLSDTQLSVYLDFILTSLERL